MELSPGSWDVVGSPTSVLGVAFSCFYDDHERGPSSLLSLRPTGMPKRGVTIAGVSIRSIARSQRDRVTFEGIVRSWNRLVCQPRFVAGHLYVASGLGQCQIGPVVDLPF